MPTSAGLPDPAACDFQQALQDTRAAITGLQAALAEFEPFCAHLRSELDQGREPTDVVIGAKHAGIDVGRRRVHHAMREFESALQRVRGMSVVMLVDGRGMTITDAARLSGVSPQMARRLYRAAAASRGEKSLDGTSGSSRSMADRPIQEGAPATWPAAVPDQKSA